MGKHSIRFKITVLFAGIICILIVMLLLFNITFSEKFYMQDMCRAWRPARCECGSADLQWYL